MKAFVRTQASHMEVVLQEVPIPEIKQDEVLIQVKAFGVGIHDRYFIPGGMGFGENPNFPYVIGSEATGIITKVGSSVRDFHIDDKVIFTTILQEQGGTWAEYALAKQSALLRLPDTMSFEQGAALPVAGKTALESLRALNFSQGDTLFVSGASGAIGTLLLQMAKSKGAKIAASASVNNQEYMKKLGADTTVDYRDRDWKNKIKERSDGGVDVALAIQPGTVQDCINIVKDSGRVITVSGPDNSQSERNILIKQFEHTNDIQQLMKQLVSDVAENKIQVVIEKTYSFDQALTALEKTETRHARGKLVVVI